MISTPIKLATFSGLIGLPIAALTGNPPSEKRIIGTIAALLLIGIMAQFDALSGIADMFAWILTVVIWLNDGSAIIEKVS